jgi:formylglycine-generating enzyme required for sulfatase activity
MAGNVTEWNQDWYDATGYPATCSNCANLVPAAAGRVLRGGSFDVGSGSLPAATRNANPPATRFFDFGARCARTP